MFSAAPTHLSGGGRAVRRWVQAQFTVAAGPDQGNLEVGVGPASVDVRLQAAVLVDDELARRRCAADQRADRALEVEPVGPGGGNHAVKRGG